MNIEIEEIEKLLKYRGIENVKGGEMLLSHVIAEYTKSKLEKVRINILKAMPNEEQISERSKAVKPFICDTYADGIIWLKSELYYKLNLASETFVQGNDGMEVKFNEITLDKRP